jgi:hypothetical protein
MATAVLLLPVAEADACYVTNDRDAERPVSGGLCKDQKMASFITPPPVRRLDRRAFSHTLMS